MLGEVLSIFFGTLADRRNELFGEREEDSAVLFRTALSFGLNFSGLFLQPHFFRFCKIRGDLVEDLSMVCI